MSYENIPKNVLETAIRAELTNMPTTAFDDLRTAELTPQFQGSFEYTVDNTELTQSLVVAGGTVTQANAMAVCSTSVTTGSMACLNSKRHARYRAGLGGLLRFTTLFETTGLAGTEQYSGLVDELGSSAAFKNGYTVGFDGVNFGFHRFQNDVKFSQAQTTWLDPLDGTGNSGHTLEPDKLNVWAINFQYLGAGAMFLHRENDDTGLLDLVAVIKYTNRNTVPSTFNPNYFFTLYTDNGATTTDLVLKSASYAYFIEGKTRYFELHQPQFSSGKKSKSTVTTEVALFTVRNKSTYASKTNFIDILLELSSASIEAGAANNLGEVRLVRDATLGGTPSYSDINTTDSVMEIDVAGTTVTGGKELWSIPLAGKNDKTVLDLTPYDLIIAPGETITLAGLSANSATINGSLLWKELF